MLDYTKLYAPFTVDGATLEKTIVWIKNTAKVSDLIADQVLSDTMLLIAQGNTFELPCPCGCGFDKRHATIEHFMLSKAIEYRKLSELAVAKMFEDREKSRLQARMKLLSTFEKDYDKMLNGTWSQKNLPTFRKWLGIK